MKQFLMVMLMLFSSLPVSAQPKYDLIAGMIRSKGYVAGAKLSASGLYTYGGDTLWTHKGPNLPGVQGIAVHPQNPDIMFLACGNGCFRTTDGGQTWRITTGWQVTESQDVEIDPNAPDHVYLATAYGVWRSTNRGDSWREANTGLTKKYTQAVRVDRKKTGRVFAATEGGIYRSDNAGQSWSLVGAKGIEMTDIQQSTSTPNTWLAGAEKGGLWQSKDNAKTWTIVKDVPSDAAVYAVAIDPQNGKHMAAAGWGTYVYTSADAGATWQQRTQDLPTADFYTIIFDPGHADRLWAATFEQGIFYSDDLGKTWSYSGMTGTIVFDFAFIPIP